MLILKRKEIDRRARALPAELDEWVRRTQSLGGADANARTRYANAHFNQVQAVKAVIDALLAPQSALLNTLQVDGDPPTFLDDCFALTKRVISAQGFWDFFRDKFELRFSERFADALWVADTVAWDCYSSVVRAAVDEGILNEGALREPPLTYLAAGFSPLTWVRSSRPNSDGTYLLGKADRTLPFAIIEIPWESTENLWELMALHHEVGHDLETDLGLYLDLQAALEEELKRSNIPDVNRSTWLAWQKEIVADFVGLQLGGPAFAVALASLLLLPTNAVMTFDETDPHPTHYLRIRLCARYIKMLLPAAAPQKKRLDALADQLEKDWIHLYGDGAGTPFESLLEQFDPVVKGLMDTPLQKLHGKTLRSLMPYTEVDDNAIHQLTGFLLTGTNPPPFIKPRHIISAARLAVHNAPDTSALWTTVTKSVVSLTQKYAPVGLRAGRGPAKWKELADTLLAQPLTLQNVPL